MNARNVLPEKLLKKVQRVFTGEIWIPVIRKHRLKKKDDKDRNREILRLHRQGKSLEDIAQTVFVCKERVRQIIRNGRKRK